MACLDTTVLLDLHPGRPAARRTQLENLLTTLVNSGDTLTTTRLNVAELWVGVERSSNRQLELARTQVLLARLTILELDDQSAQFFGRITAGLQRIGRPAGDMDVLIAAIALRNGHQVITRNPRHFTLIPGLTVVSY